MSQDQLDKIFNSLRLRNLLLPLWIEARENNLELARLFYNSMELLDRFVDEVNLGKLDLRWLLRHKWGYKLNNSEWKINIMWKKFCEDNPGVDIEMDECKLAR